MNWQHERDQKGDRYLGLTALQFDFAMLGVLTAVVLTVWLAVFDAAGLDAAIGKDENDPSAVGDAAAVLATTATPEPSPLPTLTISPEPSPPPAAVVAETAPPSVAATPEPSVTPIPSSGQSPSPSPPPVVAAKDLVVQSAVNLETEVQSFRGVFETITRVGDLTFEMMGEMRFEAPDRMYMEIDLLGDSLGILLDPPSMYVNLPGQGWFDVTQEIPGFDSEAFEEYLDNRGVVDYAQQMDQLANLEQLADEEIDGDLDLEGVLSEIPEELLEDPQIDEILDLFDNVTMEMWLYRDTLLPRRYLMLTVFEVGGESVEIEVSMDFLEYNQPVDIPDVPVGAPPLDSLVRA